VLGYDIARQGRELRRELGYMPEDDTVLPGLQCVEAVAMMAELGGFRRFK
jgi:ABC-type multidrug transport system ATPase subunit